MPYASKLTSSNSINKRYLSEGCAVNAAFEKFSARWTTQILFCIHFGLNRFGLLKQRLPRISDQILGLRLNQLQEYELILKTEENGERLYSLTKRGRALIPILEQISEWQMKF